MTDTVLGYVLAGGESSRMQRSDLPADKALLLLDGKTLLARALSTMAAVCSDPRILCGTVERCARLQHLGPTVPDLVMLAGPLGGLYAALYDARRQGAAWVLLTPVDLPWMTSAVLSAFLRRARASGSAAACMLDGGIPQPLPVAIHTDAEPLLAAALQSGERKLLPVLNYAAEMLGNQSGLAFFEARELMPGDVLTDCWFRNINTPEDFSAAQQYETLASAAHQSKHGG